MSSLDMICSMERALVNLLYDFIGVKDLLWGPSEASCSPILMKEAKLPQLPL